MLQEVRLFGTGEKIDREGVRYSFLVKREFHLGRSGIVGMFW